MFNLYAVLTGLSAFASLFGFNDTFGLLGLRLFVLSAFLLILDSLCVRYLTTS